MHSRRPTKRSDASFETWPNTTFALVYAYFDDQRRVGEGVLIGPRTVLTLARNLRNSYGTLERVAVGVSWDGHSEAETSAGVAWSAPLLAASDTVDVATITIEQDFNQRYGYLGVARPECRCGEELLVYAFRKRERRSELVQISNASLQGDLIVYDLLPEHLPIEGAAVVRRRADNEYDLVGLHVECSGGINCALPMSDARISRIEDALRSS